MVSWKDSILTKMVTLDKIKGKEAMKIMSFPVEKQFLSTQEPHEAGLTK